MSLPEAQYFARRACEQIARAVQAHDAGVARVHCELTELYLSRARDEVDELREPLQMAPALRLAS